MYTFAVSCDCYPNTVESILCSTPSKPHLGDYCNGIYHFIIHKYPYTANDKIIRLSSFDKDEYEYHEKYTLCMDIITVCKIVVVQG